MTITLLMSKGEQIMPHVDQWSARSSKKISLPFSIQGLPSWWTGHTDDHYSPSHLHHRVSLHNTLYSQVIHTDSLNNGGVKSICYTLYHNHSCYYHIIIYSSNLTYLDDTNTIRTFSLGSHT